MKNAQTLSRVTLTWYAQKAPFQSPWSVQIKRCVKITEKITCFLSPFFFQFRMYFSTFKSGEVELLWGTKVTEENSVPAVFIVTHTVMASHMKIHFLRPLWMPLFKALHNCMSFSGAALPMFQCYLLLNVNCLENAPAGRSVRFHCNSKFIGGHRE